METFAKEGGGRDDNTDGADDRQGRRRMASNKSMSNSGDKQDYSDTSDDEEIIYENVTASLHLFSRLLGTPDLADAEGGLQMPTNKSLGTELLDFVSEMNRSFDVWIGYTGVLAADPRRSLDVRLHGHQDISEMVVELLQMLARNLQHLDEIEGLDSARRDLQQEATDSIRHSIEELHFLARVIRKSSIRSQTTNLSSNFKSDKDNHFESGVCLIVRNTFPNARRALCDQLGASIALRRKRLDHIESHNQKLRKRRLPASQTKKNGKTHATIATKPMLSPKGPSSPSPDIVTVLSTDSVNTASIIDASMVRHAIKAGPVFSTISTGSSVVPTGRKYPPAPQFDDKHQNVACPYCYTPLLTTSMKTDSRYWENHLDQDIQPYTCLSENCTSPLLFFVRMSDWVNHMSSVHSEQWMQKVQMSTWFCSTGHDFKQFNDLQSFVKHMKDPKAHPGRPLPSNSQLETLCRSRQRTLSRADEYTCPLCECIPDKIKPVLKTEKSEKILHDLYKHIASHLKDLAILSIPLKTLDTTGSISDKSDHKERRRMLREGEQASLPSGYDEEIRAISLDGIETPRERPPLDGPETEIGFWHEITGFCQWHKDKYGTPENPEDDAILRSFMGKQMHLPKLVSNQEMTVPQWPSVRAESQPPSPVFDALTLPVPKILTSRFIDQNHTPASNGRPANVEYLALDKVIRYSRDDLVRATLFDAASKESSISPQDVEAYVTYVRRQARRIFLLLVFMERLDHIGELHRSGLKDDDLPLFRVHEGRYTTLKDSKNKHWRCFDIWSDYLKVVFVDFQWHFLAKPLSATRFANKFYEKQPLDFRVVDGRAGSGGFSMVQKMEVPLGEDVQAQYRTVAVKLLLSDNEEESAKFYNKEKDTLFRMRLLNHRHLIQASAAFERGGTRGFIFPWADGGNLSDVWRKEDTSLNDASLLTWALSQMEGLVDGIAALAATNTRHGDLKPANILCFPTAADDNRGILKVADVGLAKYFREYTSERVVPTTAKFESRRYMPPEATLESGIYSRKSDMWSFGCVLLEFLVWLSLGRQRLLDFVAAATFNSETIPLWENRPFRVSDLAREWIGYVSNALNRAPKQTQALGDILNLIRNRLLRIDIDDRADAQEALQHIREARRKYHAPTKAKADPSDLSGASDRAMLTAQAGSTDKQQRGQFSASHYFLSPRFDIPASGGGVVLGRIIVEPQNPGSGIPGCSVVTVPQSAIHKAEVNDWQTSMERTRSGFLALWAKFKEVPGGESSGNPKSSSEKQTFSASTLETTYFLPDDEYIAQAVETPGFQEFLEAHEWRRPAFMITGIKIARGLTISENDRIASPQLDGAKIVNTGVDVGAEVAVARQKTSGDIIFAYSLIKIKPKAKEFFKGREFATTEEQGNNEGTARTGINVRDVFDIMDDGRDQRW